MCQISVVLDREGIEEKVMESVTSLQVLSDGIRLAAFFEEPLEIQGVTIKNIDFLGGKVVLRDEKRQEGVHHG